MCIVRGAARVQAQDCDAPASPSDFAAGLIRLALYIGRIGIYEILLMSPAMRRLVDAKADLAKMRELAYKEGMKPLRISAAMKVAAGLTTIEEAIKVAPPPQREND